MSPTLKLYDSDSHLREFSAEVLSCEPHKGGYRVILNQTAFFPEGGGQASDIGLLGGAEVSDVQLEDDIIIHTVSSPLEIGSTVSGCLDFPRRFAFMQNHSGEHIVSGIVHKNFGLDNVGFHLGDGFVTLDFNGELSRQQLEFAELEANRAVWSNAEIKTYYPTPAALEQLCYRSKKELEGDVRIVEIDGIDMCACCAPHVKRTGEIGIIKLLETEKMRGGTRIFMKCGEFALNDYNIKYDNIRRISAQLSAKQEHAAEAVLELEGRLNEEKQSSKALKSRLIEKIAESASKEQAVLFEDGLDMKELQSLADLLYKRLGGIRGVFSGCEEGFRFAICGESGKLDAFFAEFRAKFKVKGGGRGGMVQGTVAANPESIKLCF